ncbi:MBL fold metallo-hydrolase [Candidatus Nomurabacteria bacterium]|nr:MBL fold metallo-hydrolase [Candidatus Nomurabacteria bacterium]
MRYIAVGVLALVCVGIWSVALAEAPTEGKGYLTFAVLDVGQGDALYIEGPTGLQILIDGGAGSAVLRSLPEVMSFADRSLDAVIGTHPDADHIGGFVEVFPRYEVATYIEPGILKDTATAKKVLALVREEGAKHIVARKGMTIDLDGGAVLEVLYPDRDVTYLGGDKANEGGIVMRLTYGETCALLMADVSSAIENKISENVNCEVLKVGHHGSRFSTSHSFVQKVSPEIALISVGKNSYGHPTEQVLSVLRTYNVEIFRTDQHGTVRCISDKVQFTCE